MPIKPRIKFTPGKTYVYSGSEGVYSVIAGELLEGESVTPSSSGLSFGNGSPISLSGKDGDVYLDLTNFKVHTKSAGSWSGGAVFKGTNGSNGSNGSNGAVGLNGKGIKWGNGAPTDAPGDDDDLFFDIENQRIYPKTAGAWSDAGKKSFKGTNGTNGAKVLQGTASPLIGDGDDGDTFLDAVNHTIYKKQAGSWVSQGSSFKGTKGDNGLKGDNGSKGDAGKRGKTTLEGSGPPGTGTNLATPTAALTSALTDESMTAADLEVGDLYVDTTNHRFYRKTTLGWSARSVFRGTDGAQGLKGDTGSTGSQGLKGDVGLKGDNGAAGAKGDTGDGVSIYSIGLDADELLSEGVDNQLYFSDVETNLGALVTASGTSGIGSTFTIASGKSGRYRIELTVGLKTTGTNGTTWTGIGTIKINGVEKESTTRTGTVYAVSGSVTGYKSLFVTYTGYLREGATIKCFAKYDTGTVTSMYANALDRTTETGDDTSVVITKL